MILNEIPCVDYKIHLITV